MIEMTKLKERAPRLGPDSRIATTRICSVVARSVRGLLERHPMRIALALALSILIALVGASLAVVLPFWIDAGELSRRDVRRSTPHMMDRWRGA